MEEAQGTPALVPELPNSWHTDPTPGSPTGSLGVSWNIPSQEATAVWKVRSAHAWSGSSILVPDTHLRGK